MCQFITVILPRDADVAEIAAIFRAHGRECRAYLNSSLSAQLGDAERMCYTTPGHCDCDSPIGENVVTSSRHEFRETEVDRLRQKGWTEAKIARAIAQQNEARARPRKGGDSTVTSLAEWRVLIREILESRHAAHVGVLRHHYRGSLNDEAILLRPRVELRVSELNEGMLAGMAEDTVYAFKP